MDELKVKLHIRELCEDYGVDDNSRRRNLSVQERELRDFLRDLRSGKLKVVAA